MYLAGRRDGICKKRGQPGLHTGQTGRAIPGSNGTAAWSTASCSSSEVAPSGTANGLQAAPKVKALMLPLAMHSPPLTHTATSEPSTTSSLGRRPNPAESELESFSGETEQRARKASGPGAKRSHSRLCVWRWTRR